jgi:hypothetical protein
MNITTIGLLFAVARVCYVQAVCNDGRIEIGPEHHAGVWLYPAQIGVGAAVFCIDGHVPRRGIEIVSFTMYTVMWYR